MYEFDSTHIFFIGGTHMSYLEPFQSVALFENTFRHQLNKKTEK